MQSFGLMPTSGVGIGGSRAASTVIPSSLSTQEYKELLMYVNSIMPHGNPLIEVFMYIDNMFHGNMGDIDSLFRASHQADSGETPVDPLHRGYGKHIELFDRYISRTTHGV